MKKLLSAAMSLLMLVSCSDDDNATPMSIHGNPDPNTILVKKIVNTFPSGFTLTSNYVYEGVKVTAINKSDGQIVQFLYNDDNLPKEIRYYNGLILSKTKFYVYDENNRLKTYTLLYNGGDCLKSEFTYQSDGTITSNHYYGSFVTANNYSHSQHYTFSNDNLVTINSTYNDYSTQTVLTYDDKNSFDKNIAGKDILALAEGYSGTSNIITQSSTFTDGTPLYNSTYNYSYTYNENDYPATAVESLPQYDNQEFTTEYFY